MPENSAGDAMFAVQAPEATPSSPDPINNNADSLATGPKAIGLSAISPEATGFAGFDDVGLTGFIGSNAGGHSGPNGRSGPTGREPDPPNALSPTATGWPGKASGGLPGAVGPDPTVAGGRPIAVGPPDKGTTQGTMGLGISSLSDNYSGNFNFITPLTPKNTERE
jgi:hypothetical protein